MIEVMFAILAAAFWGLALVFIRKGLMESNFISAAFIITIIGNIFFWSLTVLFVPSNFNLQGVLLFALAGTLAPGLARISSYLGMERLGASVNGSIIATFPLFGSAAAILLLHEQPTIGILVGTVFIVCGAVLVGRSIHSNNLKSQGSVKMGIAFSLFTSMTHGLAFSIRKMGLIIYDEPILGIALGYAMAFSIYTFITIMSRNTRGLVSVSRKTFRLFWKAGLFMCLGWIMSFYAVLYGDVVVVGPLMNTEPLFIFLFAYIYLRELETVTFKLILGSLIIILGVALLSMPSTIFLISF